MQELVGLAAAHAESSHGLAGVQVLPRVVHHAAFHEVHDAVGHQFRVDTQVLLVLQVGKDGIGDAAIANLDRIAVAYDACHRGADALGDIVGHASRVFHQGFVVGHDELHVPHINEGVAQHAGHEGVYLGDHE